MNWTFHWRDEDPATLLFLFVILNIIIFTPWQSCDPTASLKYGPAPVEAPATASSASPAP